MAASTNGTESEELDPVVEEIPVYLAKGLDKNLYIVQYTSDRVKQSLETCDVLNSFVKPISQEVKFDLTTDVESRYYDRSKGKHLALASDGKTQVQSKYDQPVFQRGLVDKQTFVSTKAFPDVSKYAVCFFSDNEIHATPLTAYLNMDPSFTLFDKADKRTKAEQKALDNDGADDEPLQQVNVKFTRFGDKAKAQKKAPTDEPWCETYYQDSTSTAAEMQRQKLFAPAQSKLDTKDASIDTVTFAKQMMPGDGRYVGIDAIVHSEVLSRARIESLPLAEKLKVVLMQGRMFTFDNLLKHMHDKIDQEVTAEKLIRVLPQVGVLIHGNWVAQSEVLYPPKTFKNVNKIPAEHFIRARDYVLFKFSRNAYVFRPQVVAAVQMSAEETTKVLETVACVVRKERRWQLLLPPDKDFEQRYPDLLQRQEMIWRATEQTYNEMEQESVPKRSRKRSTRTLLDSSINLS